MKETQSIEILLKKLSSLFTFGKSKIRESILNEFNHLLSNVSSLNSELEDKITRILQLEEELSISQTQNYEKKTEIEKLEKEISNILEKLSNSEKVNETLKNEIKNKNETITLLEKELGISKNQNIEKEKEINKLKIENSNILKKLSNFEEDNKNLRIEIVNRDRTINSLEKEFEKIISEKQYLLDQIDNLKKSKKELEISKNTILERFKFINKILSATPKNNPSLDKFKHLIKNDFTKLLSEISIKLEKTNPLIELMNIEKELEKIALFPPLYLKNLVSVAGGFSSGKSTFLNSFISNENIKLPVGIEPVTAIPTFITHGVDTIINGICYNGGVTEIAPEIYAKFNFNFFESFGFNLKTILPYVNIKTNIDIFKNICFIDTPGYNPSSREIFSSEEDKTTAMEYINESPYLIWLIGLDSGGTISNSDLEFLSELDSNKKIFFVLNKADLRTKSDIENIAINIQENLEDNYINFEGISAYSSTLKKEYYFLNKSLFDFLGSINNANINNNKQKNNFFTSKIDSIFENISNLINKSIEKDKKTSQTFKKLRLDLIERGYLSDKVIDKHFDSMNISDNSNNLKNQLTKLEELKKDMKICVSNFLNELTH